jgi:formylglycine-generating enzyme required for sulfatase activity
MKNIVGNVWEWVSDWWTIDYRLNSIKNPVNSKKTVNQNLIAIYANNVLLQFQVRS